MLDLLRRELGGKALVPDDARWVIGGRAPVAVVQPENADQVAAVLALCTQEDFAVEAAGAGTWLNRGAGYERDYIVLSMARLQHVIEYEPEDLTIGVQAGMPLQKLQELVGASGQMLALDPPIERGATIGAIASLGSAGPQRCSYGVPRDQVLGLDAVTGDGRILHVGGRVVKNVAGYDVTRLLVGSHGTLSVLTRVNLKLRPRAQHDCTWVIPAGTSAPLLEIATTLHEAAFEPAAVELVRDAGTWQLLVRVHANDEALAHARSVLHNAAGTRLSETPSDAAETLWRDLLTREAKAAVYVRLSHLPSRLPQLIGHAERFFRDGLIVAHVCDGIVRVCLDIADLRARSAAGAGPASEVLREFREVVVAEGGTVLFPVLPAAFAGLVPQYGIPGPEVRLMQGMKRVLDPAGVLGSGRFVL